MKQYTDINSHMIDQWSSAGWIWGVPIDHETYRAAQDGQWSVLLTPTHPVPKNWFCDLNGAHVLGLASGGGQQMPIFSALGARCTVLDYSQKQLDAEQLVSEREHYEIELVRADMTKPFPFPNDAFDLIFHPVSNCYVRDVLPIWRECYRVLKKGGLLLAGLNNGISYAFNDEGTALEHMLPFDPLSNPALYEKSLSEDWGIQFSHTIEEQIGGQLAAGFTLLDIFQDTDGEGRLHDFGIPTYYATKAVK